MIDQLKKQYEKEFVVNGQRKYGRESEYPLVYATEKFGQAALFDDVEKVFEDLIDQGATPTIDNVTNRIIGVTQTVEDTPVEISTDFGACTLEVAYTPESNLDNIQSESKQTMDILVDAFGARNIAILGYGIQPISPPDRSLLPQKRRAATLESRFYTKYRLNGHNTDVHYHTINASEQIHIDVDIEEAIPILNALNKITPALIALYANSQVWKGEVDKDMIEPREKFWDWVVNIPQDQTRKGIPKEFANIEDYLDTIWNYQPIMTVRNKEGETHYLEFNNEKTMKEYIAKNEGNVIMPGTRLDPEIVKAVGPNVTPDYIDILVHDSFVWYDNRLKSSYGTIESRMFSQQPQGEEMTPVALLKGLVSNYKTFMEYAGDIASSQQELALQRDEAIRHGLNADVGKPAYVMANELVQIANNGLGSGEKKYLEPLQHRIDNIRTRSEDASRIYALGGIKELVRDRKWK